VVIVEQGGFGAGSAAPIARKIMEAAFNINQTPVEAPRPINHRLHYKKTWRMPSLFIYKEER
jgi:hypothetical protein